MQLGYRSLFILCLAGVSATNGTPQDAEVATPGYSRLSGVWTGSMSFLQRGKCSLGRSGRSDSQVRFRISAEADGTLLVRPESGLRVANAGALDVGDDRASANRTPSKKPWRGHVSPDQSVELQAPGHSVCSKQPREFTISYSGSFGDKRGRRTLSLAANVEVCPATGCTFEVAIHLKQRDEGHAKE